MKILYVTTIAGTMGFFKSFIGELVKKEHTVDLACNCSDPVDEAYSQLGCKVHNIPFSRSPLNTANFKAYKVLKKLVQSENYDIVHCHTPVAAACTRLACIKARKKGTKVFYTAHGFHFYKGAPLKNWLVYYPIEKVCSYFTDTLITINREDYALAQKKMKAKRVEYVQGVGIDTKRFFDFELSDEQKSQLRKGIDVPENARLLVSVGELNANKNHEVVLRALPLLKDKSIHYAIAGTGSKAEYLKVLAKELGVEERFHLLGYQKDVVKLYKIADCFMHPSFREGLPVSVMEAMACGLPIVAADNRGTRDLCENGINGFMCNPCNPHEFAAAINKLFGDSDLCKKISEINISESSRFDFDKINAKMIKIYIDIN